MKMVETYVGYLVLAGIVSFIGWRFWKKKNGCDCDK